MLRMQLVGAMKVWLDDAVVEPPSSRRAWTLLAWLALHPGMHARGMVASTFWPDVLDASARASLRSAVWALRRSLGEDANDYLCLDRGQLGLRPDAPIRIDVREVDDFKAENRPADAVDIGFGTLLAGFDDEWVIDARDAYRRKVISLLETLARSAEDDGNVATSIDWTRRQIELEPLAEEPLQRLMRRLAASGDQAAARTAYGRFREKLSRELQMVPSPETRLMADDLQAARTQGLLPVPGSAQRWPLIGRERELTRLRAAYQDATGGRAVVATISGEAGIGKSRLAGEMLDLARAEGAVVATATAMDLGVRAPFGMWAELIGGLASALDTPPSDSVWPSALAPLAPDFESRLGRPPAIPVRTSPDLERTRLYEATVGLLLWAGRSRLVVLLLEDVHAADAASLDLIGYACRRLARAPILFILTHRPFPRRVQLDALEQSLRAQRAFTTEITLGPLTPEHAAHLVREVAALGEDKVEQVVTSADGNALLAVEWAAALARGEVSPPNSLRAAVRTALAPLHGDALKLAQFAAIAGRRLNREEVQSLPLASPRDATAEAAECGLLATDRG